MIDLDIRAAVGPDQNSNLRPQVIQHKSLPNRSFFVRICLGLMALFFITGCAYRSVYDDDLFNSPVYWGQHRVASGDTLYSIAWRYGRDYKELGAANKIPPPYTIHVGDVIRLDLRAAGKTGSPPKKQTARPPTKKTTRQPAAVASHRAADRNNPLHKQPVENVNPAWHWPHVGPIIAKFSSAGHVNKGINIAGKAGDPIRAAANGEVVYAGNGLLGYGELVIVNHSERYLSAYAHNRKLLVKEGQRVTAGQVIAQMGETGTSRVQLHFEIRQDGKPVDPLRYLPTKR